MTPSLGDSVADPLRESESIRGANAPQTGSRWKSFKPFLAPILITCILAAGHYHYSILDHPNELGIPGTVTAILVSIILEMLLGKWVTGRWPHFASAYITGISVGILVRSPLLWPYIVCSLLSISSKYALRIKDRHLWNPSNLGVSVLLYLAPQDIVPLGQQWGNEIWVPVIILSLGGLILFSLGRLHITATYLVAFSLLAALRCAITEKEFLTEIGELTAPAYILFVCFMITDPKTTPRTWPRQIAVTVIVAVVETILRLNREIHAPYYALFIVFPIANLVEIWWDTRQPLADKATAKPQAAT